MSELKNNNLKTNKWMPFIALGFSIILVVLDQIFKLLAITHLKTIITREAIPNLLNFTYVENYGAAFGIFNGKRILLTILVFAVLAAFIFILLSGRIKGNFMIWTSSLIIAGGAGNLVDRIVHGFVIDYLDISPLFSFPVFNFADCCVVIGCVLLMIFLVFGNTDDIFTKDKKREKQAKKAKEDI